MIRIFWLFPRAILCLRPFGKIKQLFFVINFFFFLFQLVLVLTPVHYLQAQITESSTQSVTILNLLQKLIIVLRQPAVQDLDHMEENWLNQVHQLNYMHTFIRQLPQWEFLDEFGLVLTICIKIMEFFSTQQLIKVGYGVSKFKVWENCV